jgi:galactonate dehydratase
MKVTQIRSFPVRDEAGRGYFVVRVDTDAGIHGLGEVGIVWWGKAIGEAINHLSALVVGADPWETERLWQDMFRASFFPADKVYCCAISAIDIALWDIKGKSVDRPVYKLLGGPYRPKVVCYPHTQGRTMQELVDNSKRAVQEGWRFVRWGQPESSGPMSGGMKESRIGRLQPETSNRLAVEQMARVRDAVGPDINICFDVHTRLDPHHVIQLCRDLEEFKPFFIEDPVRSENQSTYRLVRQHVNLPIAAGEQWASKWPFRQVIEEDLIDYARIDLCNVGGLTEALKITHWAETHYIDIAPHNPLGPVSAAACVALCMASSNVGVQEMPFGRPGTYATKLFPQQIEWADGFAWCPDKPGLGVEFSIEEAERAYSAPGGFAPRLTRDDGAFTNW